MAIYDVFISFIFFSMRYIWILILVKHVIHVKHALGDTVAPLVARACAVV